MPSLELNRQLLLPASVGKELKTFLLKTDGQIQLSAPNPEKSPLSCGNCPPCSGIVALLSQYPYKNLELDAVFLSGRLQRGVTEIIHDRQNSPYQCALRSCPAYRK